MTLAESMDSWPRPIGDDLEPLQDEAAASCTLMAQMARATYLKPGGQIAVGPKSAAPPCPSRRQRPVVRQVLVSAALQPNVLR